MKFTLKNKSVRQVLEILGLVKKHIDSFVLYLSRLELIKMCDRINLTNTGGDNVKKKKITIVYFDGKRRDEKKGNTDKVTLRERAFEGSFSCYSG